jgi:hypothetical protein
MIPTENRFSRRTDWPAHPNRMAELTEKLRNEKEAAALTDLTESNPTRCGFDFSAAGWLDAFQDPDNLAYAPDPRGLLKAREAVAGYYAAKGVSVNPDQIILTSGTSEAYNFCLRLLTHAGEAIMTPAPSYPLMDLLIHLNDINQHRYALTYRDKWFFESANARLMHQPQARALVAVHPNNPTGHAFDAAERDALVKFAISENMALIIDEVFLDYAADPKASFASEQRVLTFTLSGISKILGLPQMKLSWIVVSGPESERREALRRLEIVADIFLSVSGPAQNALATWLTRAPEVHARIRERVQKNRRSLERAFKDHPKAELLHNSGCDSWTAVLRLPDNPDDEAVAYRLLEEHHLLVHPGYFYDFQAGQHLVVSLLPPDPIFAPAALVLASALR